MLRDRLLSDLRAIVGDDAVIAAPNELRVYECDGYTLERSVPEVVVLPRTTEQVSRLLRLLDKERVACVPRGAGTGLSGGCLPVEAPVMIGTSRMKAIRSIDRVNRRAVVEAGVVNLSVSNEVKSDGLLYAPDPSSQMACTIGGNVAENSGGPHTLKYGVTTNHVLGLELVLPNGEIVELGGAVEDVPGYDLTGLVVGSEGTFGIVTAATLRLIRQPEACTTLLAIFESVDDATATVSDIIAAGIVPAALEMMDQVIVAAVEAAFHFGFPTDAGAVLIIEIDGLAAALPPQAEKIGGICKARSARNVRVAADEAERAALWKSRKRAFGAVGRLAPSYCTQDGVVPRTKLPQILQRIVDIGRRYEIRIGNVFHAGDGNIHPILLFDERDSEQVKRVLSAGREILEACVELGGSVTGEHGIGVEKIAQMPLLFSPDDLLVMNDLRRVFDPQGRCNPGKIFPTPGACVETTRPNRRAAL
ncbi:MAG TPA: FAD-linked oxidase C-terminal domain-containing protein [Candidatus Acidoferrales bacterium]|nr:FAD-linked oxidase C-terminal domain-containing protein [Candidatus Acidoferrales bacterium]